jgi:uncharacterized protein
MVLGPIGPSERQHSVDVLRGVAVLGVFAMNIISMALPGNCYINPGLDGPAGAGDASTLPVWWIQYLVFELKFITIFSMLFGGGLVLMGARGGGLASVYYRRLAWLLGIGLAHALFLWYGDILISYALCGVVLYLFRNVRPSRLIVLGVLVALVALVLSSVLGGLMPWVQSAGERAQEKLSAGQSLAGDEQGTLDAYNNMKEGMSPGPEQLQREIEEMRAGGGSFFRANAKSLLFMQLFMFPIFTLWRCLGMMLVGMGLAKLGVFSASRSDAFYSRLAIFGLALGLPLTIYGGVRLTSHDHDMGWMFLLDGHFNYVGSMGVALGYVGVVMLLVRRGVFPGVMARLAAVGRMALSNYLAHSVIGLVLFSGVGLGLFAHLPRGWLGLIVLGVWGVQLAWSPWWLRRFRFGPAEWLWRSLTYWKRQPMR